MNTSLRTRRLVSVGFMLAFPLLWAGCACKPGKSSNYPVEVTLDPTLQNGSVLVDLVGVNKGSLPRWESYSMTKYWQDPNDPMRKDADKVTLDFSSGKSAQQTLGMSDPKWNQWRSNAVTHLLVLAFLPPGHTDKPGYQDARRQVLPLDPCHWAKGTKKLSVLVKQTGIDVVTPLRATK